MSLIEQNVPGKSVWKDSESELVFVEDCNIEYGVQYYVVGYGKYARVAPHKQIDEKELFDRIFLPLKTAILNAIKEEK